VGPCGVGLTGTGALLTDVGGEGLGATVVGTLNNSDPAPKERGGFSTICSTFMGMVSVWLVFGMGSSPLEGREVSAAKRPMEGKLLRNPSPPPPRGFVGMGVCSGPGGWGLAGPRSDGGSGAGLCGPTGEATSGSGAICTVNYRMEGREGGEGRDSESNNCGVL